MALPQVTSASRIVGRDREMAAASRVLAEALAGRGALLLIGGEAGIGKTALAAAIGAEAEARGASVSTGRCYDLTETPPYGPWRELFAQLPEQETTPPIRAMIAGHFLAGAAPDQAALFRAVRERLASVAARPLVLFLDDLHWTDGASLDLLRAVARHLSSLPILVIAAYRDDELHANHPLAQALPALIRESSAARLDLHRLDDAAVRSLVDARYALDDVDAAHLARYLHARTDGNPLFITEILRTLEDEEILARDGGRWRLGDVLQVRVPAMLVHLIDRRMAPLDPEARRLLALAALIGHTVPLTLWEAVADADEMALVAVSARAMAARILEPSADGMDMHFSHALVRQALYEGIAPVQRRIWHRRVAEALVALPAPDPDAAAFHFRQAGDARAVAWLVRAGERAQRAYAWQTAATRFAAAVDLMGPDTDEQDARGWLLVRLAWLRRYGYPREGIAALDEAVRIAHAAGNGTLAAYTMFARGIVRYHRGEVREGLAEMVRGVTALGALPAPDRAIIDVPADITAYLGDPRGTLVGFLAGTGHYREAIEAGERTVAGAAPSIEVSHGLGIAYAAMGRPDAAHQAFQQARDDFRALGQQLAVGESAMDELRWVTLPYRADRLTERIRLAADAEEAWTRAHGALEELPPRLARLTLLFVEGNWAEARAVAMAARANGIYRNMARSILGPLARAQGDADLAWSVVREDLPHGPESVPGDTYYPTALILIRLAAALALDAGDHATARAWLEMHERWLIWNGAIAGEAEGLLGWAVYYRACGDAARAEHAATDALGRAMDPRQPLVTLAVRRLLGTLATEANEMDRGREHLTTALTLADACAAPYERALTLVALADTHEAPEAITALDQARATATELGARPLLQRVQMSLGHRYHALRLAGEAAHAYAAAQAVGNELAARTVDPELRRHWVDEVTVGIPAAYRPKARRATTIHLTAREWDVVRHVARGESNREIADALFIAERTVEMHVSNSLSKLGYRSRTQLAAWAITQGTESVANGA